MKARKKPLILVTGVAIVLFLLLLFLKPDWFPTWAQLSKNTAFSPQSNDPQKREGNLDRSNTERDKRAEKPRDPRLNILFNNDEFTISSLKLEGYLRKVGRNDKSLTAAFLLSGDPLFLEELHRFPDSPLALAMIARESGGTKEAKVAAQRLASLFPENPQGHYWSACLAAKDGDIDAAISSLDKLQDLPGSLDVLGSSVNDEMLGALGTLGYDKIESFAYLYHRTQWLQSFQASTRELTSRLATSLRKLPEEKQAERAATVIGLFRRLNDSKQETQPLMAMTQMANERSVLEKLPPDFGYGDSGTVADRLSELKSTLKDESQKMELEMPALQQAEPKVVDEYFAIFQKDGSAAAREWLLSKR